MQHVLARARHTRRVHSVTDLIGNTPLVRVRSLERELPDGVELCAKLESFNPGGSVKDRAAWQIVRDAVHDKRLDHDKILIDATRGNTGVAYAMIGAALGYEIHLCMPADASQSRKDMATTFGANIHFTDPETQLDGAIAEVHRRLEADRASGENRLFYANHYTNPSGPKAHFQTTAPEIWTATGGRVTHFVTGMSSGGTIMGTGRRLKIYNDAIKIIGVESPNHMPTSIAPELYRPDELDGLQQADSQAAHEMIERLARYEGIFVGPSGGSAMVAALDVARTLTRGGVVVALLPDRDTF